MSGGDSPETAELRDDTSASARRAREPEPGLKAPRLTRRGLATRDRIVKTTADLIRVRGVGRTTLEDVAEAAAVSKSQLYRHFGDKSTLVRAVIDVIGAETMRVERKRLGAVNSLEGIRRWRDAIVADNSARQGRHGCPLGTLVVDVTDDDPLACQKLDAVFRTWCGLFESVLSRLVEQGLLPTDADLAKISTGFIAAVQGGYVLARTANTVDPMASSIDLSIEHLRLLAAAHAARMTARPPA